MAKRKGDTLVKYWDKLNAKQRRLIWDMMRAYDTKHRGINMGLLPFIQVSSVVRVLRSNPFSAWTHHLFETEYADREDQWRQATPANSRYKRSVDTDKLEYAEILSILTPPEPDWTSHMADQLEVWKRRFTEENGDA